MSNRCFDSNYSIIFAKNIKEGMRSILSILFVGILAMSCSQKPAETAEQALEATGDAVNQTASAVTSALEPSTEFTIISSGNNMSEMGYDTKEIVAKAGSSVKVTFINKSEGPAMEHNIVFCFGGTKETAANAAMNAGLSGEYKPEGNFIIAASPLAKQGETVEFEFVVPNEPGEHEFVCTYPGHWMNMNGTFIIVE